MPTFTKTSTARTHNHGHNSRKERRQKTKRYSAYSTKLTNTNKRTKHALPNSCRTRPARRRRSTSFAPTNLLSKVEMLTPRDVTTEKVIPELRIQIPEMIEEESSEFEDSMMEVFEEESSISQQQRNKQKLLDQLIGTYQCERLQMKMNQREEDEQEKAKEQKRMEQHQMESFDHEQGGSKLIVPAIITEAIEEALNESQTPKIITPQISEHSLVGSIERLPQMNESEMSKPKLNESKDEKTSDSQPGEIEKKRNVSWHFTLYGCVVSILLIILLRLLVLLDIFEWIWLSIVAPYLMKIEVLNPTSHWQNLLYSVGIISREMWYERVAHALQHNLIAQISFGSVVVCIVICCCSIRRLAFF